MIEEQSEMRQSLKAIAVKLDALLSRKIFGKDNNSSSRRYTCKRNSIVISAVHDNIRGCGRKIKRSAGRSLKNLYNTGDNVNHEDQNGSLSMDQCGAYKKQKCSLVNFFNSQ